MFDANAIIMAGTTTLIVDDVHRCWMSNGYFSGRRAGILTSDAKSMNQRRDRG